MVNFTSLTATSSVPFKPNGIYYGKVIAVNEQTRRVDVSLQRLNVESVKNLRVLSINLPNIDDIVGCIFTENKSEELVVVGAVQQSGGLKFAPPVVCTSTTRPNGDQIPVGTLIFEEDTKATRVWDGTSWLNQIGPTGPTGPTGVVAATPPVTFSSGTVGLSIDSNRILGRTSAGAGNVEQLTDSNVRSFLKTPQSSDNSVADVRIMTQAAYDGIAEPKPSTTLYFITG